MDKTSFIGILLGIGTVIFGVILKGSSLEVLLNPAAIVIIIIGTIAAVLIAFPFSDIKRVPKLFGVLLSERKETSQQEIVEKFVEYATISRRDGMLALESKIEDIDDPFFQQATRMMIDGQDPDFIRHTLHERIDAMQERHATGAAILAKPAPIRQALEYSGRCWGLFLHLAIWMTSTN